MKSRNPVLPLSIHTADSEAHVMPDGKLYLYGSYDDPENQPWEYCSDRYYVVSTSDMEQWTIHDTAFRAQEVPWFDQPDAPKYPGPAEDGPSPFMQKRREEMAAKITKQLEELGSLEERAEKMEEMQRRWAAMGAKKKPMLFAPDCIYKDEKYYLYFCMSDDTEGVACSDTPYGPFENPVQIPVGGIDPAIFVDEDGKAYYYWSQFYGKGVQLHDDMISFDEGEIKKNLVTEMDHFFHEGSSMRRIGDTYYYVYADMERGKPTALGYATSKSPLGPFTYKGIIVDNAECDPHSWNNHGSIECFQGQWYIFYHRSSRNGQNCRRLCIEPITINEDGSIDEVKMTSQGAGPAFAPGEKIMGYQACGLKGEIYIDVDDIYEEALTSIGNGDEAVFRYVQNEKDWTKAEITASGEGTVEVWLDGQKAGIVTICSENSDGSEEYHTCSAPIKMAAGVRELKLIFTEATELKMAEIVLK